MLNCVVCGKELTGSQKKYCSNRCKCRTTNAKFQNYNTQQERGHRRRLYLIHLKGGKCSCCGYSKNTAALAFHHVDTENKLFQISIRECSNNSMKTLLNELAKCILLCHNCHAELHNPDFMVREAGVEPATLR